MQTQSTQDRRPVRRVVIAGGGTAGWMVAAGLSKVLGKRLDIKLVESDEIGTVGVGEATIPTLLNYHSLLEINEREFMAATMATFKLGISFEGWRNIGEDYIHSFGMTGTDHWTAGFQHFWMKGRERGLAGDYGDYCLELKAAQENKFAHLPRNGLNYAYQMDASRYARFLRKMSEQHGAKRIEGKITKVNADPATGHIASLTLDSGTEIEGDLFIDCTGFRALLIGQTLGVPYEDWSHWLFNDSAIAIQTDATGPALPMTRTLANSGGWQWRIPLQHRMGNGIVFSSRYVDEDWAKSLLMSTITGKPLVEPRLIRFKPGHRYQTWKNNCVAIGLSSGFLEPIESTSVHLIQRGIIRLMQLFPSDGISQHDIDEFNAQANQEMEHIRDFIILHYKVNNRPEPYWTDAREMKVTPSLQHRIDLFRETGRVFRVPNELFAENSWIQVMLGQGIMPRTHHQTADLMGDGELSGFLDGIRDTITRTVAQLPPHQTYVDQYCGIPRT